MEKRKYLGKHRPTIFSLYKALIYKMGPPNTACSTFGKMLEELSLFFMFFDLLESSQNVVFPIWVKNMLAVSGTLCLPGYGK